MTTRGRSDGAGERRGKRDGTVLTMTGGEQNTPFEYTVQEKVNDTSNDICVPPRNARESGAMAREDEGARLDQALAAHNLNRAKLAKKLGLAASTVQKWRDSLTRGDIKPGSWNSCARALMSVGIDPREVRPGAEVPTKTHAAALIPPLMAITDRSVLSLILDILEIEDNNDRAALLAIVRVKLQ